MSVLPAEATFCPGCGTRLVARRTPWVAACSLINAVGVRMGRRRPPLSAADAAAGPRIAVVVGYANALWRLGWRYEHGRGVSRNVAEAIRCYHKSAGLGNAEAQGRLEPPARPVVPIVDADAKAAD